MFGALVRNALYLAFGALFAGVVQAITGPFIDVLTPAAEGTQYLAGLQALHENVLLVFIIAVGFALLARSVVESRLGGVAR
jgi:hypothetical protein